MKKELSPEEALFRAAALCSTGERCQHDISEKLAQWGVAPAVAAKIVKHLVEEGYIDEARYCRSFVNDKWRFDRWGRVKMRYALKQKGLSDVSIQSALDTIDESEYRECLRELLDKKRASLAGDEREIRAKLLRFAASRGFEPAVVFAVIGTETPEDLW